MGSQQVDKMPFLGATRIYAVEVEVKLGCCLNSSLVTVVKDLRNLQAADSNQTRAPTSFLCIFMTYYQRIRVAAHFERGNVCTFS